MTMVTFGLIHIFWGSCGKVSGYCLATNLSERQKIFPDERSYLKGKREKSLYISVEMYRDFLYVATLVRMRSAVQIRPAAPENT